MRYGIKHGGIIYVGHNARSVVRHVERTQGEYRECGEAIPGGWSRILEAVDEPTLRLLADDYKIHNVDRPEEVSCPVCGVNTLEYVDDDTCGPCSNNNLED